MNPLKALDPDFLIKWLIIDACIFVCRDCTLEENVILGSGTCVEEGASISRSVIGPNCKIGTTFYLF